MSGTQGPSDDVYDAEGYDESQRAEILEATRDGPSDGTILTDLSPDTGDDDDDDEPEMDSSDIGEETDVDEDERAAVEDDLQEDFDDDKVDEEDLGDADDATLRP